MFVYIVNSESEIDAVALSEDGLFMVVGEANGGLHFLNVATRQPVFAQVLRTQSVT